MRTALCCCKNVANRCIVMINSWRMATAIGVWDTPEFVACVVGLSRGRGENFTKHKGIGKSCLCYRFMYPGFDDYVDDHQSLLALHEFENAVFNNVHFLYWGSVVKRFPMKASEKYTQIQFHVVEQTVFYQDVTSQPFTITTKPDSLDHYIKRITGPIESPGKISYKSRNDTDYSQRQQYPSGLSRLPRGFMVVLDVSLAENDFEIQCERAEQLLEHLMKNKGKYIIVATKRDNYDFASLERAYDLESKYRTQLIETSANGNLNVHDAFRLLACKTLHKKSHGLSDNILTYEDAAHSIVVAKRRAKQNFQTFLSQCITDSNLELASLKGNEIYCECKLLIGRFETNQLFAVHVLKLHNEKISSYAGVLENPDMRQEFLEEFVDQRSDLTAYSQYLKVYVSKVFILGTLLCCQLTVPRLFSLSNNFQCIPTHNLSVLHVTVKAL